MGRSRVRKWVGKSHLQLAVGASLLVASAIGLAAPAEVGESSGDVAATKAPEGTTISAGDGKVSGQTGSFGYSIPIAVPPGRLGAEPNLSLSYSSQAPLYGTIAAGWSLGMPTITRDFSDGPSTPERWISSLTGRELVENSIEPAPFTYASFRSKSDPSYARYQRSLTLGNWIVLMPDGSKLYFEEFSPFTIGERTHYYLARSSDKWGNEVHYTWQQLDSSDPAFEPRLVQVDYTINDSINGGAPHAQVLLSYDSPEICTPGTAAVGSKVSYRSGHKRIMGSAPLASITTRVVDGGGGFRDVRRYDFDYDDDAASCDPLERTDDSPMRILTSVTETAWSPSGVPSSMPPITFEYGGANSPFIVYTPDSAATSQRVLNAPTTPITTNGSAILAELPLLAAAVRATGMDAWRSRALGDVPRTLLRDIDGDGVLDLLYAADPPPSIQQQDSRCYLGWRKGLGLIPSNPLVIGSPPIPSCAPKALEP